jgi:hypothetical protein
MSIFARSFSIFRKKGMIDRIFCLKFRRFAPIGSGGVFRRIAMTGQNIVWKENETPQPESGSAAFRVILE